MDASNSTATVGDFRVADLIEELEQFPENIQTIQDSEEIIKGMIAKLKPVLRHITAPICLNTPSVIIGGGIDLQGCITQTHTPTTKKNKPRAIKVTEEMGTPSFPSYTVILFLDEDGHFCAALETTSSLGPIFEKVWVDEKNLWERFKFGKVFGGLEHLFMVATAKHRQHTDSLEKRHNMMRKLKAIVSEPL